MKRRPHREAAQTDGFDRDIGDSQRPACRLLIIRQHDNSLWLGLHGLRLLLSMVLAALLLPPTLLASTRLPSTRLSPAKTSAPDCSAADIVPQQARNHAGPTPGHTAGNTTRNAACNPTSHATRGETCNQACNQACRRAATRNGASHAAGQKVLVRIRKPLPHCRYGQELSAPYFQHFPILVVELYSITDVSLEFTVFHDLGRRKDNRVGAGFFIQ